MLFTVFVFVYFKHLSSSVSFGAMDINAEIKLLVSSCLRLSNDYRYLAAKEVYLKLSELLNWNMHSPPLSQEVEQLLTKNAPIFEKILKRVDDVEAALNSTSLNSTLNEHGDKAWVFGSSHLGVTTHYMVCVLQSV